MWRRINNENRFILEIIGHTRHRSFYSLAKWLINCVGHHDGLRPMDAPLRRRLVDRAGNKRLKNKITYAFLSSVLGKWLHH